MSSIVVLARVVQTTGELGVRMYLGRIARSRGDHPGTDLVLERTVLTGPAVGRAQPTPRLRYRP